ncbi:proton-conducting transporter membrane subunit [Proteinivorax tanatarense]|uniref:Proton-conducting transporter membrane subunit n=1 Tax=Proteinivorax tanatarense TaxID=1260629 RepID=A0AAU7VKN8_9FIRM
MQRNIEVNGSDKFVKSCKTLLVFFCSLMLMFFLVTEGGQRILNAIISSNNIPLVILFLIFVLGPSSTFFTLKQEQNRDIILLYTNFAVVILVSLMYPLASSEGLYLELSNILGFGLAFRVEMLTFYMLMAASLLWLLVTVFSHSYLIKKEQHRSRFYLWFMITYGGVMGAIMADSLITMFLFFEIMYISCYFLVAHNSSKTAIKAGNRYIYMGVIGGLSMLLAICVLYVYTGTFNLHELSTAIDMSSSGAGNVLFLALVFMLLGFAIKAAVFPLHFWLPDAHSSAPSPASAVLSGMVIKVYIFSLIKFLYIGLGLDLINVLKVSDYLPLIAAVGMVGGSLFALRQTDIKRMLAYSTVAQVGYMVLGLGLATSLGVKASMFHISTHLLMKAALFLSAGAVMYQTGRRDIEGFKGIGYKMPITMGVFTIGALSMIGIPGVNGFMSKWYLSIAAIEAGRSVFVFVILLSSFLNAMYYLPIIISAYLKRKNDEDEHEDMEWDRLPNTMTVPLIILGTGCIILGVFPQILMNIFDQAVNFF